MYEISAAQPTVRLPLDESAHCGPGGEWWYYTGRVTTDDGQRFGLETVIFHVPGWPLLIPTDAWVAHFAVLDEATGFFVYQQSRTFAPPTIGDGSSAGFDLYTPLVQMVGGDGHDHVTAALPDGTYALDLTLDDIRGAILHDLDGYVPHGVDGRSFYYSRPRMRAAGTLRVRGDLHNISGEFWFDRQWGRDLTNPWLAWNWFSLRLDDGSDVMLYVFRDTTPRVAFGTFIPAAGAAIPLTSDDFDITPTAWWTSPHTGATYPVTWEVHVIPQDLTLTVSAVVDDQELDATATTLNVYWEGLCDVTGARAGQPTTGYAYVELTNYPR